MRSFSLLLKLPRIYFLLLRTAHPVGEIIWKNSSETVGKPSKSTLWRLSLFFQLFFYQGLIIQSLRFHVWRSHWEVSASVITHLDTKNLLNELLKVYKSNFQKCNDIIFGKIALYTFNRSLERFSMSVEVITVAENPHKPLERKNWNS